MSDKYSDRIQAMKDPTAFFKPEIVTQAVEKEPDLRNKLIIQLLFRGGMRTSEMTGIEVKNILWNENCIIIPWLKKRRNPDESVPVRKIPIDNGTLDLIQKYLQYRDSNHLYRNGSSRLIPLDRRMVYLIVRRAFERIGIFTVGGVNGKVHHPHPHTLRHSYATYRVSITGGDLARVKRIQDDLGHANIGTTLSYLHSSSEELHREYDEAFGEGS